MERLIFESQLEDNQNSYLPSIVIQKPREFSLTRLNCKLHDMTSKWQISVLNQSCLEALHQVDLMEIRMTKKND